METETGLTHGFLFADLRGYTRFVESRGDAAAAGLLGRYRTLVRAVIAQYDGAEIRTEGDSFYVVFRSASQAVRAGLHITADAASDAADHPDAPIMVGIGVHAGETIESGEGPVGSAVNIAARICSTARPGEVLVSETVRALTRATLEVTFRSRGRPRLKGIDDPIELFSAVRGRYREPADARRVRARPRALALAGLSVVLVVGVAALGLGIALDAGGSRPTSEPGAPGSPRPNERVATPAVTAAALRIGALPPGEYVSLRFKPQLYLGLASGWQLLDEIEGRIILSPTAFPEGARMLERGGVFVAPGQVVIGPINAGWTECTGEPTVIGPTAQDMLDWLEKNPNVAIGQIEPISLRNQTALRVRVEVTDECLDQRPDGIPIVSFVPREMPSFFNDPNGGNGILAAKPGTALDWYLIDLRPQALSIVAFPPTGTPETYVFQPMATALVRALTIQ